MSNIIQGRDPGDENDYREPVEPKHCPKCTEKRCYEVAIKDLYECESCGYEFTVPYSSVIL